MKSLLLVGLLFVAPACASHVPQHLSPQATTAWYGTRVIRMADLLRDTAHDAARTKPPLVSSQTARQVLLWHSATIDVVHAAPTGWQRAVLSGLDDLKRSIQPEDQPMLTQYIALVESVLKEVAAP